LRPDRAVTGHERTGKATGACKKPSTLKEANLGGGVPGESHRQSSKSDRRGISESLPSVDISGATEPAAQRERLRGFIGKTDL
jgi:hypothetical protein